MNKEYLGLFEGELRSVFSRYPLLDAETREEKFLALSDIFFRICPPNKDKGGYEVSFVIMAFSVAETCMSQTLLRQGARDFIKWCFIQAFGERFFCLYAEPDILFLQSSFSVRAPDRAEQVFPGIDVDSLPRGRYFLRWFPYPHIVTVPLENGPPFVRLRQAVLEIGEDRLVQQMMTPFHVCLSCGVFPYIERGSLFGGAFGQKGLDFCKLIFGRSSRVHRFFLDPMPGMDFVRRSVEMGERVLSRWVTLGIRPGVHVRVTPAQTLSLVDIRPEHKKMLDEDLLLWHDVLVGLLSVKKSLHSKNTILRKNGAAR